MVLATLPAMPPHSNCFMASVERLCVGVVDVLLVSSSSCGVVAIVDRTAFCTTDKGEISIDDDDADENDDDNDDDGFVDIVAVVALGDSVEDDEDDI